MIDPIPIDIPPGVVNVNSRKKKTSAWRETNLIRWDGQTMRPVGGWEQTDHPIFPSRCRAAHKWIANDGKVFTAYLCEEHLFVEIGGVLTDVSPTVIPISPPLSGDFAYGGYGDGLYSADLYGTPRDAYPRAASFTPVFTLDNWGEDLLAMSSADGRLLYWSPSAPTDVADAVTNAPETNRSFSVTPERHVILYGADGNSYEFAWCDQEDIEEWTPGATTKAGLLPVEPRSPIVAHKSVGDLIAVFTNRALGVIQWVGLPYVYSYRRISDAQTPYSAASIVELPDGIVWPGTDGFWAFNGVSVAPFPCPIWDWVLKYIDPAVSKYTAVMMNVSVKSEFWWFFASTGSEQNDRYVSYDYKDRVWSMGKLARTCGLSYPNDVNPIMSDGDYLYKHEQGFQYPGVDELPWAETFTLNVMDGHRLITVLQLLPEVEGPEAIQFKMIKSMNPTSDAETTSDAKAIRSNGYVDVRETARDMRVRVEMIDNADWSLGVINVAAIGRGQK